MKSNKQFLESVAYFSLIIVFVLSSLHAWGQVNSKNLNTTVTHAYSASGKITVTKLKNATYAEKRVEVPDFNAGYKIFCDVKSVISDTLMKVIIIRGQQTEELFGLKPTTFLKEIHFICDKNKSFFTN